MTAPMQGEWTEAPHLAEEIYNLEDALVVAQWLNVFLRKCDVLKIGCVAQIVNIISWLQTTTGWPAQAGLVLSVQTGEQSTPAAMRSTCR